MRTYSWGEDSAIEKIEVRDSATYGVEAVLYPNLIHPRAAQLLTLPDKIRGHGMEADTIKMGGTTILRVTGFEDPEQLLAVVESGKYVNPRHRDVTETPSHVERAGNRARSSEVEI